jgi:polyisoprenoid-binding protein YceI
MSRIKTFVKRRWKLLTGLFVGVAAFAIVGIPWIYIHILSDPVPPKLDFGPLASETAAVGSSSTENTSVASTTWQVTTPSKIGYRVKESIAGQEKEAVGVSETVDGSLTIDDKIVRSVEINVGVDSIVSGEPKRDVVFKSVDVMDAENFPVASFVLSEPIVLASRPNANRQKVSANGTLSIHGVEKPVIVALEFFGDQTKTQVVGEIPIAFSDFEIKAPSRGPVSVQDNGKIEFAITFAPANA